MSFLLPQQRESVGQDIRSDRRSPGFRLHKRAEAALIPQVRPQKLERFQIGE
jgi:hypothetical protein